MTAYRATLQPSGQTEQTQPVRYGLIGFGGIAENRLAREGFGCDAARVAPPKRRADRRHRHQSRPPPRRAPGASLVRQRRGLLADPAIDAVVVATNN